MQNVQLQNHLVADSAIISLIRAAFYLYPKVEVCGQLDAQRRVNVRIFRNLSDDPDTMPSSDEMDMISSLTESKNVVELYHMDRASIQRAIEVAKKYPDVRLYITFRGYEADERQKQTMLTSAALF